MTFRNLLMTVTGGLDPVTFDGPITVAGVCMFVFRSLFLKKKTIALLPRDNYSDRLPHSTVSFQWLKWVEEQLGRKLVTHWTGGEWSIGRLKLDGYDPVDNTAYEMLGESLCGVHG